MTLAAKVLVEYCQLTWIGGWEAWSEEKKAWTSLSTSTHGQVIRERDDETAAPLWDEELFLNQMRQLRGWSVAQATMKWKAMLSDDSVDKDHGGPDGSLRQRVPSNLVGNDLCRTAKGEEERRTLKTSQRAHKATPEEQEAIRADLLRGFASTLTGAGSDFHSAVGPNSVTATFSTNKDASEKLLLESAGLDSPPAKGPSSVSAGGGGGSSTGPSAGSTREKADKDTLKRELPDAPPGPPQPSVLPARDVALERNKISSMLASLVENERTRLLASLKLGAVAMHLADLKEDADDLVVVKQRHAVAMAVMGAKSYKIEERPDAQPAGANPEQC